MTATAQPISTPQPTITPTVITMDQNVEAFLSGEFDDVSNLSLEERKEFSVLLTQKMNEARGAKPLIYNNEAYVDPITGMMKDYDGHPDLDETIQMYLAVALDEEGNLLIQNEEGTWVKINGSKDMDWNMVVTDPINPRIDWPTGNENKNGLTPAKIAVSNGCKLTPMVILDADVTQLYMSGENALMQPTITLLQIETDNSGGPIIARKMLVWSADFQLYKEGTNFFADQNMLHSWADGYAKTITNSQFFNNLKDKQLYYSIVNLAQEGSYKGAKLTSISEDYENVVEVNKVLKVLENHNLDEKNILVVVLGMLIEPE